MKRGILISLRNLAITLLVIAFVTVSVEAVLTFKNRKAGYNEEAVFENQNIQLLQVERALADNTLFMASMNVHNMPAMYDSFELNPELQKGYPLIDINTKSDSDNAFNIVVIGDSFVWGTSTLNKNELFWRVLENDFRREGKNVNVYGVGISAANAYEELSWLTDSTLIEDLDPDLVVFGYVYNDADDSVQISGETVNWEEELPFLNTIKNILPNIYNGLIENIAAKTMYTSKYSGGDYVNYDGAPPVLKGRFYEKYKTDFAEKLDAFAAESEFSVAVVTLPTRPNNFMLEQLYKPLDEIYSKCENVNYYNCIKEYNKFASGKHSKNYQVNAVDFHPGSSTNRFYADYIKDFVEKDFVSDINDLPEDYNNEDIVTINDYLPYGVSPTKTYEDEKFVRYEIEYPSMQKQYELYGIEIPSYYLVSPLGEPHTKLSFSQDINISEVKIEGGYDDIRLYYTRTDDKLRYDDHETFELKKTDNGTFPVDKDINLTSILISADFSDEEDRKIVITLKK